MLHPPRQPLCVEEGRRLRLESAEKVRFLRIANPENQNDQSEIKVCFFYSSFIPHYIHPHSINLVVLCLCSVEPNSNPASPDYPADTTESESEGFESDAEAADSAGGQALSDGAAAPMAMSPSSYSSGSTLSLDPKPKKEDSEQDEGKDDKETSEAFGKDIG